MLKIGLLKYYFEPVIEHLPVVEHIPVIEHMRVIEHMPVIELILLITIFEGPSIKENVPNPTFNFENCTQVLSHF